MSSSRPRRTAPPLVLIALAGLTACTPPIRQFDIKDQALSCEDANRYAHDTLKAIGYTIVSMTPAVPGGQGSVRGELTAEKRASAATVVITCAATGPSIDASEDGKLLGRLDFKRAFYLAFTSLVSQRAAIAAEATRQAALPPAQRARQGFEILVSPVAGLDARMEFAADLSAAGVLPVHIAITNRTQRRYQLDPTDIVLVRHDDGTRVPPLDLAAVLQRVRRLPPQPGADGRVVVDVAAAPPQLQAKLFTTTTIEPDSSDQGYLFYPLAQYDRARVRVTEAESQETEGFVIEF